MSDTAVETSTKKRLVLIDGHSLAFRVYYGLERTNMRIEDGTPVWAVYGFLNSLFRLLQKIKPDALAMAFDVSKETFRTRQYSEYKANRGSMPEDMKVQMDLIYESVELLGIPVYKLDDYEADDVIGTLCGQAVNEGYQVDILTGDQDAFQLVDDGNVHVLIPPRTVKDEMKTYTRDAVFEKMGVWPEQVIDFKGLKGDTSDNIPGVPGVGDKTASKLLGQFETLEGVYQNLDTQKGKLLERLTEFKDQAELSKDLATIRRDAPVTGDFSHATLSVPNLEALFEFLGRMEFKNFQRQAVDLLKPFVGDRMDEVDLPAAAMASNGNNAGNQGQLALGATADGGGGVGALGHLTIPYTLIQTESALNDWVKTVQAAGICSLDIETTGLDIFGDKLVGISMAVYAPENSKQGWQLADIPAKNPLGITDDYPETIPHVVVNDATQLTDDAIQTVYIPMAHETDETQLSQDIVLTALKPLLTNKSIVKIAHNAKFELNFLRNLGVCWQGLVLDTMVMSYVDVPERRHGLKSVVETLFGTPMQPITELIGKGAKQIPFSQAEFKPACDYAACDSWTTLKLAAYLAGRLNAEQFPAKATLYSELEGPTMRVLAVMEYHGIALDDGYLNDYSKALGDKLGGIEQEIYTLAGLPFNINSPKQVGELLFERMGIEPTKKTKGKTGYSTDAKVLEKLAPDYPIVAKIQHYRQLAKLKNTYVDSLPTMVNAKTGHIHTSFNQTVVATGRLSSSDPNLQNIPIRSEEGRQIRRAFIPRVGSDVLLSADYSQIELRLLAHVAQDEQLIAAFNAGQDIHSATAALVFDVPLDQVTKEQRYGAKAVNFGVIYGQTPHGLSQQLNVGYGEAADFISRYFERYPRVKSTIERIQAEAELTGKVTTLFGRVRDLSRDLKSSNRNVREFALRAAFNTVLQGSAADLMKLAMIRLDKALDASGLNSRLLLQVHDEMVFGVPNSELETLTPMVVTAMELGQPLRVPLVIDVEVGPNWMEQD